MQANRTRQTIPPTAELLSLGVAILTVMLIAIFCYRDWLEAGRINEQLDFSRRIAQATTSLLSTLKDAETGQRGYLLTGRESYLAPYRQALTDAPRILSSLTGMVENRPDQARRVAALDPLVRGKLDELRQTIEFFRSNVDRYSLTSYLF